jgi:hypothetical protein
VRACGCCRAQTNCSVAVAAAATTAAATAAAATAAAAAVTAAAAATTAAAAAAAAAADAATATTASLPGTWDEGSIHDVYPIANPRPWSNGSDAFLLFYTGFPVLPNHTAGPSTDPPSCDAYGTPAGEAM